MTNKAAKDILGTDKESEFLQSFVRVGLRSDGEDEDKRISIINSSPKKGDLHKQNSDGRSESSEGRMAGRSKYNHSDQLETKFTNRKIYMFYKQTEIRSMII